MTTIAQKTFDEIYDLIEDRLNVLGSIQSGEAWVICKGKTQISYVTIINVIGEVMNTMVEQGKAYKVRKGLWEITKPNDPLAWLENVEIKHLI